MERTLPSMDNLIDGSFNRKDLDNFLLNLVKGRVSLESLPNDPRILKILFSCLVHTAQRTIGEVRVKTSLFKEYGSYAWEKDPRVSKNREYYGYPPQLKMPINWENVLRSMSCVSGSLGDFAEIPQGLRKQITGLTITKDPTIKMTPDISQVDPYLLEPYAIFCGLGLPPTYELDTQEKREKWKSDFYTEFEKKEGLPPMYLMGAKSEFKARITDTSLGPVQSVFGVPFLTRTWSCYLAFFRELDNHNSGPHQKVVGFPQFYSYYDEPSHEVVIEYIEKQRNRLRRSREIASRVAGRRPYGNYEGGGR